MIHQLKDVYSSIIPFEKEKSEQYHWYETDSGEVFGIHQNEITEKDEKILQVFCKKYEPNLPKKGVKEQLWYECIFEGRDFSITHSFRFIYFALPKRQMTPIQFQEAFGTLFEESFPILWETESEGIIIEEIKLPGEEIHFEQIINILMADLSVNIRFLVGSTLLDLNNVSREYSTILNMGRKVFDSSQQNVIHYTEAIPYLLIQQLSSSERAQFASSVLKDFETDQEMLQTLHMFFKHHLNISETAKHMYMHRNSLQYRIDKFMKETGISVQSFSDALTVKLALLATRGLENDE